MSDIIERLERAREPDFELDVDIAIACPGRHPRRRSNARGKFVVTYEDGRTGVQRAPRYTYSIDDAMRLVLECHYLEHLGQECGGWTAKISDKIDDRLSWEAIEFPTAPAAISAAALRARASQGGRET